MFGETKSEIDNGMAGKYVIVRCRDAGVHAGILESHSGRECVLKESRRLWYWKNKGDARSLSGIATNGVHKDSKVGDELARIHLTENCEIIQCTSDAETSIRKAPVNG
jgi:hypothetical protein